MKHLYILFIVFLELFVPAGALGYYSASELSPINAEFSCNTYSVGSMHIANGGIQTVASQLGGTLADEAPYLPERPRYISEGNGDEYGQGPGVPGVDEEEILSLEFSWDVVLLYMLLLGVFCIVQIAKVRFLQEK